MLRCILVIALVAAAAPARADSSSGPLTPIGLAVWDPLGFRGNTDRIHGVSLNLLVGKSHEMFGIELSVFGTLAEHAAGVQVAGLLNLSDRASPILQVAGLGNAITGRGAGIQGAGLVNYVEDATAMLQLAGAANIAGHGRAVQVALGGNYAKDLHGAQVSLAFNRTAHALTGLQLAFGNQVVEGDLTGIQLGIVNLNHMSSRKLDSSTVEETYYLGARTKGLQIGAIMNANSSFTGLQIGFGNITRVETRGISVGVINVTKRLRGLQLGIVNITQQLHGVQIGAINVATKAKLPFTVLVNADF